MEELRKEEAIWNSRKSIHACSMDHNVLIHRVDKLLGLMGESADSERHTCRLALTKDL